MGINYTAIEAMRWTSYYIHSYHVGWTITLSHASLSARSHS